MARLLSVNVGLPREVQWKDKTVLTAIWKSPVEGRRIVRKLNLDGDAQADLAGHGGEQRAVFVYQMDSYDYWRRFLGRNDFTFGASSARTSQWRDLLTMKSASVINIGLEMRCLKSHSHA